MAVKFYPDNRPDKNGDNPIRVSISINEKRFVTSTGFSINNNKWNDGKVKNGRTNAKGEMTKTISARLTDIDIFFKARNTTQIGQY